MNTNIVYQATLKDTDKHYVGITKKTLERRVSGHSADANRNSQNHFHRALRKYGDENFEWQVRATLPTQQESQIAEKILIALENPHYNSTAGGEGSIGYVPTEETRKKISIAGTGRKQSAETIEKRTVQLRGQKRSAEQRARMSASATGKIVSDSARANMSACKIGHPPTGPKKHTEETRQKMRDAKAAHNPHTGMKRSDETRLKMSLKQRANALAKKVLEMTTAGSIAS